jgi:hypothetical protein
MNSYYPSSFFAQSLNCLRIDVREGDENLYFSLHARHYFLMNFVSYESPDSGGTVSIHLVTDDDQN